MSLKDFLIMGNIWATLFAVFSATLTFSLPLQAEKVTLFDSNEFSTLDWEVYPVPSEGTTGLGWQEIGPSYERRFRICSVDIGNRNNWLRLPYIERQGANAIHVEVSFTMSACSDGGNAQLCKETFDLYYMESDSDTATGSPESPPYQKVSRIAADGRFTDANVDAQSVVNIADEHFGPLTKNGFYVAFLDSGACMSIARVQIYYVVCPEIIEDFAIFNRTFEGGTQSTWVDVPGTCVDNAVPLGGETLEYHCVFGGQWAAPSGECGCAAGYEPTQNGNACQACSTGTYKDQSGNTNCRPCPAGSHADFEGQKKCTCVPKRFRAEDDPASAPCFAAPRAPVNLVATVDNQSSVVTLTWESPEKTNVQRVIMYWIECRLCPNDAVQSPPDRYISGTQAVISNLDSHTTYQFRVHSYSSVSDQSSEDYFSIVNATTFSSVPSRPRDVKVLKEGSSENAILLTWLPPLYANGEIKQYEIRYRPSELTEEQSKYQYSEPQGQEVESKLVEGLQPGKEYIFEVVAKNENGRGIFSQPVLETTKGGAYDNPLATAIIAGAISAIFIIALLVAAVIFLVFWRRKSIRELERTLEKKGSTPNGFHRRKANRQLYYKIATSIPRNKEMPTLDNGSLVYSNGLNSEPVILPHITKVRTYIDPSTYENPDEAVREFASEIDSSCIRILDVIGGGEFGDVCSGIIWMPDKTTRNVAVKTLKTGATDKDRSDFLAEASIMGQFDDPNVIRLLGVVTKTRPAMIVTEFMENGSLDKFLRENDGRFTITQLLGMMRGIASGMRYLSEMNYVHRDLAARNILVNEHLVCKVADFGLSRRKEVDGAYETKGGKIPIRWTAPEAIAYKKFTSASDVWSLGIVMWEIMSYGERPYWNWPNQDVIKAVEKGYRLPPPMDCPEAIHQLMLDCWQRERNHRPTFSTIVSTLDRLIRNPNALRCLAKNGTLPMNGFTDISQIHSVEEWLESLKMTRYKDSFAEAGYVRLEDIAMLSQSDLPRLGVTLVGHQKKIMKGIHSIRAQLEQAAETLV
ncbi:Ephrin type-B receptor 2 [Holothuria leucospilota]|uniref:receptor protein-tyrosine kinase n=1 Tax=Holothuria leucospilota TaxID=206669 RepID=A0A9Q0YG39_HOLLE|nr:Ephrin type-B receptor 2 [Holothuria leucospilota]